MGSAGAALPTQEVMDEIKELDAEIASAAAEVDTARDKVNNVIPDEARKAGIPPGWLREVEYPGPGSLCFRGKNHERNIEKDTERF